MTRAWNVRGMERKGINRRVEVTEAILTAIKKNGSRTEQLEEGHTHFTGPE